MTNEEKIAELQPKYGKVTVIEIDAEGETITGFFKEPSYDVVLYVTDCLGGKETSKGGEALIRYCLIPEASDTRITDQQNNPKIAASFVLAAFKLFGLYGAKKDIKKN